jgi:uncharacterized membrane protein
LKAVLYLLTGFACLFWGVPMLLIGQYGGSVSYLLWHVLVLLAALTLMAGGIMSWVSSKGQSEWVSLIGTFVLFCYFAPAAIIVWHQYGHEQVATTGAELVLSLFVILLVLISFVVAVSSKTNLNRR